MSKEYYEAIVLALETKKLVADTESGIVYNPRSKKTGYITHRGYKRITVKVNNKRYKPFVHQVIVVAGGVNPTGLTINHKNGNKLDNRLCNLEAVTLRENLAHATRTGLKAFKLTAKDVIEIKRLIAEKQLRYKQIAELYNVSASTISDINNNRTWSHLQELSVKAEAPFFNEEKEREYLQLQELYNNSTNEAERKALKRALYEMEVM